MIQRIQSVYLLLAAIAAGMAMGMPVASFVEADGITTHVLRPLGLAVAGGDFQSTWGLFGILLLSVVISVATIFFSTSSSDFAFLQSL